MVLNVFHKRVYSAACGSPLAEGESCSESLDSARNTRYCNRLRRQGGSLLHFCKPLHDLLVRQRGPFVSWSFAAIKSAAAAFVALAFLAVGCSSPESPEVSEPEEAVEGQDALPPDEEGAMAGDMTLRLFDEQGGPEGSRHPLFTITSPGFFGNGAGQWGFNEATALIREPNGDTIEMRAGAGELNQQTRRAVLRDSVTVTARDLRLELEELEWLNDEGIARSDKPLEVVAEYGNVQAEGMELHPADNRLYLNKVRGSLRLGSLEQP
ncbi:MAG: LPS export ABC transporter periplasmic protein LptC [Candidatus Hydrogenedentota bacterium]